MAYNESATRVSFEAGEDLSSKQFFFVSVANDGQVTSTGDGAYAVGVNHGDVDAAGKATDVVTSGKTKVVCGASITQGGPVASDANGKAVDAASGDVILGEFLENADADGEIATIMFHPRGTFS